MSKLPWNISTIKEEFKDISYSLDERRIRLWCAAKARTYNQVYGRGGVMAVHKATKVSAKDLLWFKRDSTRRDIGASTSESQEEDVKS